MTNKKVFSELFTQRLDRKYVLLTEDFHYYPEGIIVPKGFKTDYASIERVPLIYMLFGGYAPKASVIHDWMYKTTMGRKYADDVFLRAMKDEGVARWRRYAMYAGVRIGGWLVYNGYRT